MSRELGSVVIGVGGNALITAKDRVSIAHQYEAVEDSVRSIVDAHENGWKIVLTHGSGPQVGNVLQRSDVAAAEVITVPIDYAGADIQGALGYMFSKALANEFNTRGIDSRAVAVVTMVVVDEADPAFDNPSKPIGPFFDEAGAKDRARRFGWIVKEDSGRGWRRFVPSPEPLEIVEADQISKLIDGGFTVVACGGGGIPVSIDAGGRMTGVEAVIDKDLASSLLATRLGADVLLLSTGVPQVAVDFGTADQRWLDTLTIAEARRLLDEQQFDPGSMGPKVEAMLRFLANGGKRGVITDPANIAAALAGAAGTRFVA
jgi:carbamate kinase